MYATLVHHDVPQELFPRRFRTVRCEFDRPAVHEVADEIGLAKAANIIVLGALLEATDVIKIEPVIRGTSCGS